MWMVDNIQVVPYPTTPPRDPTVCAVEGQTCSCSGIVTYGKGKVWTVPHRVVGGSISCTNNVFGDPLRGTRKECRCQSYVQCAVEGKSCECTGYVAYGKNGTWTPPRATGGSTSMMCSNKVFGDPLRGVGKQCMCMSTPFTCAGVRLDQ